MLRHVSRFQLGVAGILALAGVCSCSGEISGGGTSASAGPSGGSGGSMTRGSGAGGSGARGSAGSGDGAGAGAPSGSVSGPSVPPAPLARRLTASELRASIAAVFGVAPAELAALPDDPAVGGFENDAEALTVSTALLESYRKIAGAVARDALVPARRAATLGCDLAANRAACLGAFVDRVGRRMYRRPLAAAEKTELLALAAQADKDSDPAAGPALVIQGLMLSPSFLYRVDVGSGPGAVRALAGAEIATRLSFLILGGPPDDALLDDAAAGKLDGATGVAQKARELLKDPRARPALRAFFEQWLRLRELDKIQHATSAYPAWGAPLRASMLEETRRLIDDFAFAPKGFLDILTAPYTYLDGTLATLYGVPAPATAWQRVSLTGRADRGGLLSHASVLAVTARSEDLAPILRGKYVRDVWLCDPPSPPPDNVPPLPAVAGARTLRERLAAHRTNPTCAGCHEPMDPVGFGFERYDALGAYREKDALGNPLTGQGNVTGLEPAAFSGPLELGARLQSAPATAACVVKQLFRYAHGRAEEAGDARTLEELTAGFRASSFSFPELIVALVSHASFRTISSPTPPAGGICQ